MRKICRLRRFIFVFCTICIVHWAVSIFPNNKGKHELNANGPASTDVNRHNTRTSRTGKNFFDLIPPAGNVFQLLSFSAWVCELRMRMRLRSKSKNFFPYGFFSCSCCCSSCCVTSYAQRTPAVGIAGWSSFCCWHYIIVVKRNGIPFKVVDIVKQKVNGVKRIIKNKLKLSCFVYMWLWAGWRLSVLGG